MLRKILVGLLVVLILIQFIRPGHNDGVALGAQDITHSVAVPDSVMGLLKTACFDCHSDHTNYPWYSKISPVNWWLKNHIDGGKRHLNFTTFDTCSPRRKDRKLDQIAETVKEHEMPISTYLWIHKEARLDDAQRAAITNWANAARAQLGYTENKDVSSGKP